MSKTVEAAKPAAKAKAKATTEKATTEKATTEKAATEKAGTAAKGGGSKSAPKAAAKATPEPAKKGDPRPSEGKAAAKGKPKAPKEAPAKDAAKDPVAKEAPPKAGPPKAPREQPAAKVAPTPKMAAAKPKTPSKPSERILVPRGGPDRVGAAGAPAQAGEERVLEPRQPDRTSANGRMMVTGPLESKRFGRALVIDISAPQVALTARRGLSLPRASLIVTTAAREIIILAREAVKVDTIVVVGSDGDPSGHPDLREITENLRALRDKHLPRAKLRVMTAARDLSAYDLRSTLSMYDRVHLQFEWGSAKSFAALTGEKPTHFATLVKHASGFDHLVVEANFFKGVEDKDNSTDAEVKAWIKKLQELKPQEVHVLGGLGSGAGTSRMKPVAKSRRDEIVEEVAEKTGLNVSHHDDDVQLL